MPQFIDRIETRRLCDRDDAQLVEVLPRAQYELAHLPGAVNLPLGELAGGAPERLESGRPVVVYCNSFP